MALSNGVVPWAIGGDGQPRPGEPTPSVPPLTLEASSSLGRELAVTYGTGNGPNRSAIGAAGTWSATVASGGGTRTLTVSSRPSMRPFLVGVDLRSDIVTCRVTDATGAVVVEQEATGENASVSCTGY